MCSLFACSASSTSGSKVTITFEGVGITLYGAMDTNHGSYTVSLDGSPPVIQSGNTTQFLPQIPIVCYFMAVIVVIMSNVASG
jgi:hypothetical protein